MSAFNRCKDCGDRQPVSGWTTKTASLCNDCAANRPAYEESSFTSSGRLKSSALVAMACLAGAMWSPGRVR